MTDLAGRTGADVAPALARARTTPTLAAGCLGGLALGIVARGWMRLIAEDPAFTWSGTLFIVFGFTIFGLSQAVAVAARRRAGRRWLVNVSRAVGSVGMLPLFMAAGALLAPTVLGGGFAVARSDWRRVPRAIALAVAAVPVVFVGRGLVGDFGWSLHALAGVALMLAVYGTIVGAVRATLAPVPGGRRSPRWVKGAILSVAVLAIAVPLGIGGIR